MFYHDVSNTPALCNSAFNAATLSAVAAAPPAEKSSPGQPHLFLRELRVQPIVRLHGEPACIAVLHKTAQQRGIAHLTLAHLDAIALGLCARSVLDMHMHKIGTNGLIALGIRPFATWVVQTVARIENRTHMRRAALGALLHAGAAEYLRFQCLVRSIAAPRKGGVPRGLWYARTPTKRKHKDMYRPALRTVIENNKMSSTPFSNKVYDAFAL